MPRARQCVFCGYPEVTKEHAFPKWLRKVVSDRESLHAGMLADVTSGANLHRSYAGLPFNLKVGRVCRDRCNGGWMNALENDARPFLQPMLEGRGRVLHEHGQHLVATWAYKTALMLNFAIPEQAQAASDAEYGYLYDKREPPSSARVFMFAYEDDMKATASFRQHPLWIGPKTAGLKNRGPFDGYTMTFSIAQLGFQVFNTTVPGQEYVLQEPWNRRIHRIWPLTGGSLTWTPKPALNTHEFVAFADTLGAPT
jgi:hypothetical protein